MATTGAAVAVIAGLAAGIAFVALFSMMIGTVALVPHHPLSDEPFRSYPPSKLIEVGECIALKDGRTIVSEPPRVIRLERGHDKEVELCVRSVPTVPTVWRLQAIDVSEQYRMSDSGYSVQVENDVLHFAAYRGEFAGNDVDDVPPTMGEIFRVKLHVSVDKDAKPGEHGFILECGSDKGAGIGFHMRVDIK